MTKLVIASWLATQVWCWDPNPEPDIASYRMYWGASGIAWCAMNHGEVAVTVCTPTECCIDIPEPTGTLTFFMVVAVDTAGNVGESEHGEIVSCP